MDFIKKNTGVVFIGATLLISVVILGILVLLRQDEPTQREQEFRDIAVELGLDGDKFLEDFNSEEIRNRVEEQKRDITERRGSQGTPTLVIAGEIQEGLPTTVEEFQNLITSYSESSENLPIIIELFEDFNCPFCASFFPLAVQADYLISDDTAIFEHKHLPFLRENSYTFAYAAEAAGEQGKKLEYSAIIFAMEHDTSYENYSDIIAQVNQEEDQTQPTDLEVGTEENVQTPQENLTE